MAANPFEAIAAEAASQQGVREFQDIDHKIEVALACPCVAGLREGPCGPSFVAAFSCFLRSAEGSGGGGDDEGAACSAPFQDMQACMVRHPEAFSDFVRPQADSEAGQDAEQAGDGNGNGNGNGSGSGGNGAAAGAAAAGGSGGHK